MSELRQLAEEHAAFQWGLKGHPAFSESKESYLAGAKDALKLAARMVCSCIVRVPEVRPCCQAYLKIRRLSDGT
jgi:hypothetical protein